MRERRPTDRYQTGRRSRGHSLWGREKRERERKREREGEREEGEREYKLS